VNDVVENPEEESRNKEREPERDELWEQLANAVAFAAKQDQIVWTIFGVFWAADAVLLVALFTDGKLPEHPVGIVVSVVGFAISLVWSAIQIRAFGWLKCYETVIKQIEVERLHVPALIAVTGSGKRVDGVPVRGLMITCPLVSAALWGWAIWWFCTHQSQNTVMLYV
jgi:hypothetical protein